MQYLIAALPDQGKFTCSQYIVRLTTLHQMIREMQDDYEGGFIIEHCESSIKQIALKFYEQKMHNLLKENPLKGYRLLCQFVDNEAYGLLDETEMGDFNELFNETTKCNTAEPAEPQ